MKKRISLLVVCMIAMLINTGCRNDSVKEKDSAADDEERIIANSPAYINEFYSLEDFTAFAISPQSDDSQPDRANMSELNVFYLPASLPDNYELYKITAGAADIGFWYLPAERAAADTRISAEVAQEYFLFISARGTYSFGSVAGQFISGKEELVDGRYILPDNPDNTIIWEQDGEVMLLYVPKGMDRMELLEYCDAVKYVRNESTQSFTLQEDTQ